MSRVILLLLALGLVACAAEPSEGDSRNETEWDAVRAGIAALPGVSQVDGGYRKDASNPGGAVVLSITVAPGTDPGTIADEAVKRVWESRVNPVTSMTVTAGEAGAPAAAIDRHADFVFDKDELTKEYGPRP